MENENSFTNVDFFQLRHQLTLLEFEGLGSWDAVTGNQLEKKIDEESGEVYFVWEDAVDTLHVEMYARHNGQEKNIIMHRDNGDMNAIRYSVDHNEETDYEKIAQNMYNVFDMWLGR